MFRNILVLFVILILATSLAAAEKYKKYELSSNDEDLIKISFSDGETILTFFSDDNELQNQTISFNQNDVIIRNDTVYIKNIPVLNQNGLFAPDGIITPKDINKVKLETDEDGNIEIFFTKKSKSASSFIKSSSKNKIGLNKEIYIEQDEFLRGSVAGFWSDIKIDGEVNGSVIALFGNIDISDRAIIRGDIFTIGGDLNYDKNSTIYGNIYATNVKNQKRFTKSWNMNLNFRNFTSLTKFVYNRVDGATPYFGYKYLKGDSALPEISAKVGYGFASERWRYEVGLKQLLFRNKSAYLSGTFYKSLISGDDRIISENENTLFALFATEDYKDYLEAEGGKISAGFKFPYNIDIELNYQIEKYKWLPAHSGLWSMFGGSKEFRQNFSSLGIFYDTEKWLVDNEKIFLIGARIDYNKLEKLDYPYNSFNSANVEFEWAPSEGNNRFSYTRYLISATRYQTLNKHGSIIITAEYGKISGDLTPVHRAFFMGGLGTWHGYLHKEYAGSEFWLSRIDYGIKFPMASWKTWLFFETGQITNYLQKLSDAEVKSSIGIGLTFNNMIRLNVAKRLDRSKDTMKLYVRLKHQF